MKIQKKRRYYGNEADNASRIVSLKDTINKTSNLLVIAHIMAAAGHKVAFIDLNKRR